MISPEATQHLALAIHELATAQQSMVSCRGPRASSHPYPVRQRSPRWGCRIRKSSAKSEPEASRRPGPCVTQIHGSEALH